MTNHPKIGGTPASVYGPGGPSEPDFTNSPTGVNSPHVPEIKDLSFTTAFDERDLRWIATASLKGSLFAQARGNFADESVTACVQAASLKICNMRKH